MGLKEKMVLLNKRDSDNIAEYEENSVKEVESSLFKVITDVSDLKNIAIGDFIILRGSFRVSSTSNVIYDLGFKNILFDDDSILVLGSLSSDRDKGLFCTSVTFKTLVHKINSDSTISVSLLNIDEIKTLIQRKEQFDGLSLDEYLNKYSDYNKQMEDLTEKANEAISGLFNKFKPTPDESKLSKPKLKNNTLASENKTLVDKNNTLASENMFVQDKYNSLVNKYNVLQSNYATLYKLYHKKNDFAGFAVKVGLVLIISPFCIIILMGILDWIGLV